jgi:hypothetical protein
MNIIYNLAFLVLLQFSFCSDRALQLPKSSTQTGSVQIQKRDNVVDANIVLHPAGQNKAHSTAEAVLYKGYLTLISVLQHGYTPIYDLIVAFNQPIYFSVCEAK